MREEKLKIETLINEIAELKKEMRKISGILESRLIGLEKPTNEEIKVIEEFEERKKKGKLKLIPLNKIG